MEKISITENVRELSRLLEQGGKKIADNAPALKKAGKQEAIV